MFVCVCVCVRVCVCVCVYKKEESVDTLLLASLPANCKKGKIKELCRKKGLGMRQSGWMAVRVGNR